MGALEKPMFRNVCFWNPLQQIVLGIMWNESAYGWVHECYQYDGEAGSWELVDDLCWEPVDEDEADDGCIALSEAELVEFRDRVYENNLALEGDEPAPFELFERIWDSLDTEQELSLAEVEEILAAA